MSDFMTQQELREQAELKDLRQRAANLREAGYAMAMSSDGWSVSYDGVSLGSRQFSGFRSNRPGILVVTDAVGALEQAVACAETHQRRLQSAPAT